MLPSLTDLPDENATLELGHQIALSCQSGVFHLSGELGAGKTTLVRGFLRALGHQGNVKSPTYTLIEPYVIDGIHVSHMDFYRIKDPVELEFIGLEDVVSVSNFIFIEWPELGREYTPNPTYHIQIAVEQNKRQARIQKLST